MRALKRKVRSTENLNDCQTQENANGEKEVDSHIGKDNYSQSQRRRHKLKKLSVVKGMFGNDGFMSVEFNDEDGQVKVVLTDNEVSVERNNIPVPKKDIDEMIFIMDSHYVTDKGYHEIAQKYTSLPRACNIFKRRQEINNTFDINTLNGEFEGVFKSLEAHLIQTLSQPFNSHFIQDGKVQIKLSGDGTRAGTKKHLINVSYTVIGDKQCMSERGNYLLAIVQCPETGECIQKALKELTDEFNTLNSVEIDGKMVVIEIGGDLKFLNQVTGIGGFASTFSCLWCRCPKVDRSDVAKKWFMTDTSKGARTIEEITKCAKMSNNSKTKFNCKSVHIFHSVPICKVIPDTLHLFRRIMDQLVYQLTFYLQHCDGCVHLNPKHDLKNCNNLMRFQNFIKKSKHDRSLVLNI